MQPPLTVTVVICTWNRARLLDQTLTQMRQLRTPPGCDWELLVVNNNCTDNTDAVVARHADGLPLRLLHEPRPGKSYAANAALAAARGRLLLWTDDDVLVEPDWLESYARAAERWPQAAFFVGAIRPWFEAEPPGWVRRHLGRLDGVYVIADRGDAERPWVPADGAFGANMAFRTAVARQFPLNPDLGRIRGELIGGDDTELVQRVVRAGHGGVWLPSAQVRHFVPAGRLNTAYLWKWYRGAGRNLVRQQGIGACPRLAGLPRWVVGGFLKQYALAALTAPTKGVRWFESYTAAARYWGVIQEVRDGRHRAEPAPAVAGPPHITHPVTGGP